MKDHSTIALKGLKHVLKLRHMKTTELAKRLGIGRANLYYYQSGAYQPSMEVFVNMCVILDCDARILVNPEWGLPCAYGKGAQQNDVGKN